MMRMGAIEKARSMKRDYCSTWKYSLGQKPSTLTKPI
jgi:hypothetical protein